MSEQNAQATTEQPTATHDGAQAETAEQQNVERVTMTQDEYKKSIDRAVDAAVKTHLQKQQEQRAAAEKARELEEAAKRGDFERVLSQKEQELAAANERLVLKEANYALREAALKLGMVDLDCLGLLSGDVVKGCVKDDGAVDVDAARQAIESLKQSKPFLFADQQQRPKTSGSPTPGNALPVKQAGVFDPSDVASYANERNAELKNKLTIGKAAGSLEAVLRAALKV